MNQERRRNNIFQLIIIVAAACLVHGIMQGVHDNYGIMMNSLTSVTGIDYASISFCIGVGALVYGFSQPFLGMLALKKSNTFVIMLGIVFTVSGLIITPLCRSFFTITPLFWADPALWNNRPLLWDRYGCNYSRSGRRKGCICIRNCSGQRRHWRCADVARIRSLDFSFWHPGSYEYAEHSIFGYHSHCYMDRFYKQKAAAAVRTESGKSASLFSILKNAFQDRDYRLILIGFATCGFNMSIIESHLFSQFRSYGIAGDTASLTFTVYGIATMLGAAGAGFLGVRYRMKNVLGCVYTIRVLISLGFIFLPKSVPFTFIVTALLGLSGDSTVPPTSGIISKKFGAEKMAVFMALH